MALKKQLRDKDGNLIYPDVGIDLDEVIYGSDPGEVSAPVAWIETADIKDGQITTAKVADGAITDAKVASGAITPSKLSDTGWVLGDSYIDTTYFGARDHIRYRILGGIVYWSGEVFCHTAPGNDQRSILINLPTELRSTYQVNIYGSQYRVSNSNYTIWTEADHFVLWELNQNIPATADYQGYNLGQLKYVSNAV